MQGHEVIATKSHGTPGRWAYRQMMGRLPMGSMAPTDCATPALVGGSSLLRWAVQRNEFVCKLHGGS